VDGGRREDARARHRCRKPRPARRSGAAPLWHRGCYVILRKPAVPAGLGVWRARARAWRKLMNGRRFAPLLVAAASLALAIPAAAQTRRPYNANPNTVRLRVGEYSLNGDSQYWDQRERDFTGGVDDFDDTSYGIDYTRMMTERFGVLVSAGAYEGSNRAAFLDFVDDFGDDITHRTTLEMVQLELGAVFHLMRRDAVVSPYLGGGIGFYGYDLEESGDFIDFDTFDIFNGTFTAEGDAVGGFFLAGIEIPITDQFGFFGEGRWRWADDELGDDFEDFGEIALGGDEFAAGVSFRF
jgi:hypothetical protein